MRASALLLAVPALLLPGLVVPAAQAADAPRPITYRQWDTAAQLRTGTFSGTTPRDGRLRLTRPTGSRTVAGHRYATGTWTSPWVRPGFALTELVPSWAASTPRGTLVQVDVRAVSVGGSRTSWDGLGRWAGPDTTFRRTSMGSQRDDPATSVVDRWGKAHDVDNLYVVDGSVFVTAGGVNPTNTICALALLFADRLVERRAHQRVPA